MSKPVYTSIPPTTDNIYWMLKFWDGKTSIYVPRDKELDRQLKVKFQAEVAARTSSTRRKKTPDSTHTVANKSCQPEPKPAMN